MAAMTWWNERLSERGAELVEFAIAMPVMLLLMAGIVDFAMLFQSYEVATNAAREGARLAVLPGYQVNDYQVARARVANYMTAGGAFGSYTTTIAPVGLPSGGAVMLNGVQVSVDYTHQFLIVGPVVSLFNGSLGSALTFHTEARMRMEVQP
jgi:Flp pilus assembly protein TadG